MWFGFVYSHFCDKLAKKQKFIKKKVLCVNANGWPGLKNQLFLQIA